MTRDISTVEFLPFGLDWTHVAEIRFNENKDLPVDNDPPRRQKVRNSTVEDIYIKALRLLNSSGYPKKVRKGKTPVLDAAEVRTLLDSIGGTSDIDLRERR